MRRRFGQRATMGGVRGRPVWQPILSPEAARAQERLVRHRTRTGPHRQPFRGRCHRGVVGLRSTRPWHSGAPRTGPAEPRRHPARLDVA